MSETETLPALATLNLDTRTMISNIPSFVPDYVGLIKKTGAIVAVTTKEQRQAALDARNTVRAMGRSAEDHYNPLAKALGEVKNELTGRRGMVTNACTVEMNRLDEIVLTYDWEEDRKRRAEEEWIRREAQARADVERKRLEAEAAEAAANLEEEARRIKQEAQQRATELEAEGRTREAEAVKFNAQSDAEACMSQAETVIESAIEEAAQPALIPEVILANHRPSASASGASTAVTYGNDGYVTVDDFKAFWEAANENPAYRMYWMPDMAALRAHAKAVKERFAVPGVASKPKESLRSYGVSER